MTPDCRIKLVSELLDLPLMDSEGCYCGIVDDVEFQGSLGKGFEIKALLVGPGAYTGRLPRWACAVVRLFVGARIVRVPWDSVKTVVSVVRLKAAASDLGLGIDDDRASRWLPRKGAL